MKKLMLSLAVACVSAVTAFADGQTWFANAVDKQQTVGSWTINDTAASLETLMGDKAYITYKNMDADLTFTVADAKVKYLPADVATVNTTVKFTAMAMEDFVDLTNNSANVTAWADAKGGLTIIEEPDSAYKFYGLVGGKWQELADSTVKAADVIASPNAVPVEVKIWQNNGRKISYKVNNAFIGDSEDGLTASGTGTSISSIAYRGNCEISSLTGNTEPEMWNLTLNNLLAYADATLKVGSATFDIKSGSVSITGTTEKVQVVYSAPDGKMFFPTTGGAGTSRAGTSEDQTKDLAVNGTKEYDAALTTSMECAMVVAEIVETEASYKSLADAISEGANKTVKVVSAPEETAQTIEATMTLNARNGESSTDFFTVAGNITIDDSAALTILGGNFSGKIDGQLLISGPSTFAQVDKETASGLCTTGWFAKDWQTTGAQVVAGATPTEVVSGVTISYDESEVTLDDLKKTKDQTANKMPGWVNYALGLDNTTTEKPNIVKADANAGYLKLAASTKGRPGTGYVLKITTDGGGELPEGNLDLASVVEAGGTCVIKSVLTKAGATDVPVSSKTIGVKAEEVSHAEAGDAKLITVPYVDINAGDLTIDTVINKENIGEGSILSAVSANNSYVTWKKTATGWEYQKKSGTDPDVPASEYVVKPGQALWLQAAENSSFYQFGEVATKFQPVQLTANAYNLLASPSDAETATLEIVNDPSVGDVIRIERATGTPEEFLCTNVDDNGVATWQWTHKVNFRTRIDPVSSTQEFNLGEGAFMWYDATSGSKASIQW